MAERGLQQARFADFRSGIGRPSVDTRFFRPQMETLSSFMAGKGRPEDKRLTMKVNNREEVWHRHEPGFADGQVKVVSVGAHPDDTALDSGLVHLLVKKRQIDGEKKTRLGVITATPGQKGERPEHLKIPLEEARIEEDVKGTECLGADFYANLGFTDGRISHEMPELIRRLQEYFLELQPDIVVLPDPTDFAHDDHVYLSIAAVEALSRNKQEPIVAYTESQNGDSEITKDHIGFALTQDEYGAIIDAYLAHQSQTAVITEDIETVIRRPLARAESIGHRNPLGVVKQDMRFSQKPLADYLGERAVQLPATVREHYESVSEIIASGPTVVFERS